MLQFIFFSKQPPGAVTFRSLAVTMRLPGQPALSRCKVAGATSSIAEDALHKSPERTDRTWFVSLEFAAGWRVRNKQTVVSGRGRVLLTT